MEYVFLFLGLALFGAVCHYFGMRRRRPEGETHLETIKSLTGSRPRVPPR